MNNKKTLKLKTIGKIGREIGYFVPVFAGVYIVVNFMTWAS
jgi:hypothetical protein|tara:strand:+ start:503 stop:625 length:123 start_codon:yes stop_codon:yes gene_type:complete